jgi:hypothetical protein
MTMFTSRWNPKSQVLRTDLTGTATVADVRSWQEGLAQQVERIPDGSEFRLLLNLRGYDPADLDAHKAMRVVVPTLLIRHGMRPAFVDLVPNPPEIALSVERGIRCIAFANVHHDEHKMREYAERISKPEQRFFTDLELAQNWLMSVRPMSGAI